MAILGILLMALFRGPCFQADLFIVAIILRRMDINGFT